LFDLVAESELDAATLREKMAEAYDEALAQAVKDGVITQEQADDMPKGLGFGGFGRRGGFGSHGCGKFGKWTNLGDRPDGEKPGFWGPNFEDRDNFRHPRAPDTDEEGQNGMRFRRPGRMIQGDNTL
jgi:hypothetical protein